MSKRKYANIDQYGSGYRNRFTVNGKRYAVYGKSIDEVKEKEQNLRRQLKEGKYKPGHELTFSEYYERWIEARESTVKESTINGYNILFNMCSRCVIDQAGSTFGNLKLIDIEVQNVRDLQTMLRQKHYILDDGKSYEKDELSTNTVNGVVRMIRSILRSAVTERILTWNAAEGVKALKRVEAPARDTKHRALTTEETNLFISEAKQSNSWYYNLYVFLLHTGCRIGEAGAFNMNDIVKEDTVSLSINKTLTISVTGSYVIGSETKSAAGKRIIPLVPEARQAIRRQRIQNRIFNGIKVVDLNSPVFLSSQGRLINNSSVNDDIEAICSRIGINKFTAHAFRATFATRCVESGMQPKVLQDILGHSNIAMTMDLYAHSMEATRAEQMRAVNFK